MSDKQKLKAKACELARSLLQSDENYIEKVIDLRNIGNQLHGQCWNTEFHIFGAIETETDHLPLSKTYKYCSSSFLNDSLEELDKVIEFYKQDVTQACNEIIKLHNAV